MALRSKDCRGGQRVTKSEVACAACGKRCACGRVVARVTIDRDPRVIQEEQQYSRVGDVASTSKTSNFTCRRACRKTATSVLRIESKELVHGNKLTKGKPVSNQKSCETVSSSNSTHISSYKQEKKEERTKSYVLSERNTSLRNRSSFKVNRCFAECRLHGYPDCNWEESVDERNCKLKDRVNKMNSSDSPTLMDFPTKLQTWEHRTRQRFNRRKMPVSQITSLQKTGSKDQIYEFSKPRNCPMHKRQYPHRVGKSLPITETKIEEPNPNADVCLRPSLIKAAQRNIEMNRKNCIRSQYLKNQRTYLGRSKKSDVNSSWNENLKIIKHRDSMSILMDKFKRLSNNQPAQCTGQNEKNNINEIDFTLGVKRNLKKDDRTSIKPEDVMRHKIHLPRDIDSITNQSIRSLEDDKESTEHFSPGGRFCGINNDTKFQKSIVRKRRENNPPSNDLRRVFYT